MQTMIEKYRNHKIFTIILCNKRGIKICHLIPTMHGVYRQTLGWLQIKKYYYDV